jgi:hypothetical protein
MREKTAKMLKANRKAGCTSWRKLASTPKYATGKKTGRKKRQL